MTRERILVDFESVEDAKKVEETVKTGYAETAVENIVHWVAAEGDLVETYSRLAGKEEDAAKKKVFQSLLDQSKKDISELSTLLDAFESLDRQRVRRIESLAELLA